MSNVNVTREGRKKLLEKINEHYQGQTKPWFIDESQFNGPNQIHHALPIGSINKNIINRIASDAQRLGVEFSFDINSPNNLVILPASSELQKAMGETGRFAALHTQTGNHHSHYNDYLREQFY